MSRRYQWLTHRLRRWHLIVGLIGAAVLLAPHPGRAQKNDLRVAPLVVGVVQDTQLQPVVGVTVTAVSGPDATPLAETTTQADGRFALPLSSTDTLPDALRLQITRAHFQPAVVTLSPTQMTQLRRQQPVSLPITRLEQRITPAFWIAALVFLGMLALIAFNQLHNTLAALVGASVLFAVSYLGPLLHPDLFIFDFEDALGYVDWNVIFLIMGMMIVIAVVERTGVFQWSAFMAYRLSGGRPWLLVLILKWRISRRNWRNPAIYG